MKLRLKPSYGWNTLWARLEPGPEGRLSRVIRFGVRREYLEYDESDPLTPQGRYAEETQVVEDDHDPPVRVRDILGSLEEIEAYDVVRAPDLDLDAPVYESAYITNTERREATSPPGVVYLGKFQSTDADVERAERARRIAWLDAVGDQKLVAKAQIDAAGGVESWLDAQPVGPWLDAIFEDITAPRWLSDTITDPLQAAFIDYASGWYARLDDNDLRWLRRWSYPQLRRLGFTTKDCVSDAYATPGDAPVLSAPEDVIPRLPEVGEELRGYPVPAAGEGLRGRRLALSDAAFSMELGAVLFREIDAAIDSAVADGATREEALSRIAAVARRWIPDPTDLPSGLRDH